MREIKIQKLKKCGKLKLPKLKKKCGKYQIGNPKIPQNAVISKFEIQMQKIRENSNRNSFKWQKLQKILILKTSKCVGKINEIP